MSGLIGTKRWKILAHDEEAEETLVSATGIAPLVARVLVAHGIYEPDEARAFLSPSLERDWSDPLLIPGMDEAADRVEQAIKAGETIAIFGDFDVDGMSAASLLSIGLRSFSDKIYPFIPDRFQEGYGLSQKALTRVINSCHPDLIVTVDNGIAAASEVAWLREQSIDVVVTDHHEPGDLVPQGVAVADPKLSDSCPSRELAGAGVALKLVSELGRRLAKPDLWRSLTDLACLGTVSDMMILKGENRALVADGIAHIRNHPRPGIMALAERASVKLGQITSDALPFSLVPRLNAAGRMGQTDVAFRLLFTDDATEAAELAGRLEQINTERRQIESALTKEAATAAEESWHPGDRVVIVSGEGWHEGVKGIVASRLVARYHVPAIVFSCVDGQARGSGRSVGTVDLFHAVEQCEDLTIRFGGHAAAVGVTLEQQKLPAFKQKLEEAMEALPASQFEATKDITALVRLCELNVDTIASLEALQPFGPGNERPLFGVRGISMRRRSRVGALGAHLRFVATDGISQVPAIMFRTPDIEKACDTDAVVDLVFEATNETWQGHTKAKLMVKDILYRDGDLKDIPEKIFIESQAELDDEERAGQDLRSELAGLDEHALSDRLVAELGGKKVLSKAQKETLECLAAGSSMLCVSTQGFSSSLISCIHAAREAIRDGKASIFSYPLRDIAEAHFYHLSSCLAPLGISVASLNGKSDVSMQAKFYSELADGSCDILVTTQEFLDLHAEQFRTTGGVGFVMAELSGCAGQASTHVGDKLSKTLVALGQPTALIICEPSSARELKRQLDFDETDLASVGPKKRSLSVHDCRGLQGRDDILASIVARGEKCIVYVRSRAESVSLARRLRHVVADFTDRITSYDEGLSRYESGRVEQAFRAGRLRCVVSPVAFAEGLAIADIRHVVIYELPFGRTEFDHIEAQAGRDGLPATIWPLFGRSDVVANERLLADEAPTRADLVVLYRILRRLGQGQDGDIIATDQEIASLVGSEPRQHTPSVSSVTTGVNIFSELGFLSVSGHGSSRLITMESSPQPMHLEDSALYAEGMKAKREFTDFKEWAFNCEGDKLLEHITGPVAPDLRQAADVEVRTS